MWSCQQTACCCKGVDEVVMTHEERAEIERASPPSVQLSWLPHGDSRFVRLLAKPCPLLDDHRCSVYAVRPTNCRRYACLRDDVMTEPWRDGSPEPKTREHRRSLVMMQRKAQRWARNHGWTEDMQ